MKHHRIAVIAGDGIGQEVVPAAQRVVERAAELHHFGVEWSAFPWGCEYYTQTGEMMPADGLDQLSQHDAILLGAVGFPGVPDHVSLWGLLIPIRRHFAQYINLRPVRLLAGIESPVRGVGPELDMVVVRENNEGEYSEIGGRLYRGTPREVAVQESMFTRTGVESCIRYAFDLAQRRSKHLTSATKSNGIIHTMPFWDEIFDEVSADYPEVETATIHIDALAAMFVLKPASFDVVVASNLFGDILTDLGAAVAGSIGLAPSANLNPEHAHPSMFEPVHGSAPDIAGNGVANPIGQLWSASMMLEHLGERPAGTAIMAAVEAVVERGGNELTSDLGGRASTDGFTNAVLLELDGPKP